MNPLSVNLPKLNFSASHIVEEQVKIFFSNFSGRFAELFLFRKYL